MIFLFIYLQPTDNMDSFYNAKVKVTRQGVTEIQKFLESGESWRQGAMDDLLSQLLIDVKTLDFEVWVWRFEDVFGVEIDTVLKVRTLQLKCFYLRRFWLALV